MCVCGQWSGLKTEDGLQAYNVKEFENGRI